MIGQFFDMSLKSQDGRFVVRDNCLQLGSHNLLIPNLSQIWKAEYSGVRSKTGERDAVAYVDAI